MAIPQVTIHIATEPQATPNQIEHTVAIAGPVGAGGTGVTGTIYQGNTVAGLAPAVGTDGIAAEAINDILRQVTTTVVYTPTVASPSEAQIQAAYDLLVNNSGRHITTFTLPGTFGASGANGSANATLTHIENLADNASARVVVSVQYGSGLTTFAAVKANAIAWAGNNRHEHSWPVFNSATGKYPAGLMTGAALAVAANNRQQNAYGIQLAPVAGGGVLRYNIGLESSDLDDLDGAGICTVINTPSGHRLAGGRFGYTDSNNAQRNWSVARVTDHCVRLIKDEWQNLVGSTYALDIIANKLRHGLDAIVGREIVDAVVSNGRRVQGAVTFDLRIFYVHPLESMTVNITLSPSQEGL